MPGGRGLKRSSSAHYTKDPRHPHGPCDVVAFWVWHGLLAIGHPYILAHNKEPHWKPSYPCSISFLCPDFFDLGIQGRFGGVWEPLHACQPAPPCKQRSFTRWKKA